MKLIAYTTTAHPSKIVSANPKRDWMNLATAKNPYRCLPLSMANSWGWQVLSDAKFTATWNGKSSPKDVVIEVHEGTNPPNAHFGEGTLTWHTGYLFETPYPYGLYVTGAPNYPKPNAIPLSGIVETHWLPFTFTMNWRFTQPGSFTMDIGEPFCQIFPIDMNTFDNVEPEIRTLEENKQFHDLYWDWNISRHNYMNLRSVPGTEESNPEVWQRNYFRGTYPEGKVHDKPTKCPVHIAPTGDEKSTHKTKPNVPEFSNLQTRPYAVVSDYNERVQFTQNVKEQYLEKVRVGKDKQATAIRNAPALGPVVERSEEEIEKRITFYENILRQQAKQLKKDTLL
jgi:hypothetical protein